MWSRQARLQLAEKDAQAEQRTLEAKVSWTLPSPGGEWSQSKKIESFHGIQFFVQI